MDLRDLQRYTPTFEKGAEMDQAVDELFTYREWTPDMIEAGKLVKNRLAEAYKTILNLVPACPTRSRALNMLTDCRMLANAAITFQGEV